MVQHVSLAPAAVSSGLVTYSTVELLDKSRVEHPHTKLLGFDDERFHIFKIFPPAAGPPHPRSP